MPFPCRIVLFTCIGSQQYLLPTGCDLVACQCTLVENDNFYYVRVVLQRLSNFPSSRFVSRLCTTLTRRCVHSQKVVSGIRLCNCFVFTFLDSKYLQTKQLTICYILILFKWKKFLLTVILHKVLSMGCIIAPWTRLNSVLVHSYIKSLDRFQIQKYIQSNSWCLPVAPICDECKFWCHGITSLNVFIHWHVKYISSKQNSSSCDCWSYSTTVLNPGSMSNRPGPQLLLERLPVCMDCAAVL